MFINYGFDNVKKAALLTLLLMPSMLVQAQSSDAAAEAEGPSSEQQQTYYFPGWPEQRKVRKERVPPPPPGPYMSSALSGSSVKGFSFDRGNKPAMKFETSNVPMEAFSPDIPWHSNSKSPDRWKPENGYNYVMPAVKKQPYIAMPYNMPPNYSHGYRAPVMNWPGSSSRTIPVMGPSVEMNPGRPYSAGPYAYAPNTSTRNSGYGRSNPAIQSR